MFETLKRMFSNFSIGSSARAEMPSANTIPQLAEILRQADRRIESHDILPKGQKPASGQEEVTGFFNSLKGARDEAQGTLLSLALRDAGVDRFYNRIEKMIGTLSETISDTEWDLYSNNVFLSMNASDSIRQCFEDMKSFKYGLAEWPGQIFRVAPSLLSYQIGKTDREIEDDRNWDVFDTFMNYFSRTEIRDSFQKSLNSLERAQQEIGEYAMKKAWQDYPDDMKYIHGILVRNVAPDAGHTGPSMG